MLCLMDCFDTAILSQLTEITQFISGQPLSWNDPHCGRFTFGARYSWLDCGPGQLRSLAMVIVPFGEFAELARNEEKLPASRPIFDCIQYSGRKTLLCD